MTALAAVCGALVGLGGWLLAAGLRPAIPGPGHTPQVLRRLSAGRVPAHLAAVAASAATVGLLTRWPVGAALAGLAAWTLPGLLTSDRDRAAQIARREAIAGWTESLRDTLAAAAGLEQAILATAALAPHPIRPHVQLLAEAIRGGQRLSVALRGFAAALADPTGDLVVAALLLAATRSAANLAEQLGALAATAREDVAARRRAEKSRAKAAADARIVIATTLVMAVGLVAFNRGFLHPYDTLTGQLVLAVVGLLFAVGFRWLHAISQIPPGDRVMARTDASAVPAEAAR